MNELDFLDKLRGIAQQGLTYATDPYDIARYDALLQLAAQGYEAISALPAGEVADRFRREIGGYVTPKVGVDGAVFSDDGDKLLLIRRADSGAWALPGGWAELAETPEQSVTRELREETSVVVEPGDVIAVSTLLPSPANGPHTSVHILYHCVQVSGEPEATAEAVEAGFYRLDSVSPWHGDHESWAAKAMAWRKTRR